MFCKGREASGLDFSEHRRCRLMCIYTEVHANVNIFCVTKDEDVKAFRDGGIKCTYCAPRHRLVETSQLHDSAISHQGKGPLQESQSGRGEKCSNYVYICK